MHIHSTSRRRFLAAAGAASVPWLATAGARASHAPSPTSLNLQRDVPLGAAYDVVVCGGGPAGVAAALAARRTGLTVLLVEGQGQLGGNGTSGLVSHWLGGRTSNCQQWVVGGIFRSLAQGAAERGFALIPGESKSRYQPHGWFKGQLAAGIPFDPFSVAALLDQQVRQAGIELLLLTQVVEPVIDKGRISHVIVFNKSGMIAVPVTAVIDATGDADVAARSGCPCRLGRDEDGLMTPTSLTFHVDNVDQDVLAEYIDTHQAPRFRKKISELRDAGLWDFPYEIFISVQLQQKGTMMINTTRLVGIDGTQGESITAGMVRGRDEVQRLMTLMRAHFPGFSQANLKAVAPTLGVRETRRLTGPGTLTIDDLARGKDFPDTIGFTAYGWDLPDPTRPSDNPNHGRKRSVTPIPYRVMVPQGIDNLICPGRSVNVERPVLGPIRVMAPCTAMGEAAGQAAGQAVFDNLPFSRIDTTTLREQLNRHQAIVDWTDDA